MADDPARGVPLPAQRAEIGRRLVPLALLAEEVRLSRPPPGLEVDADYALALGIAVYAFASLEGAAVCCCERLEPGSLDQLEHRTAGNVADTLCRLARGLPASDDQRELEAAAAEFRAFVGTRNNLVHSKPGTGHDGRPRLFRHGDAWTLEELDGVAAAFTRSARRLERVLETYLR